MVVVTQTDYPESVCNRVIELCDNIFVLLFDCKACSISIKVDVIGLGCPFPFLSQKEAFPINWWQ